MTSHVQKYRQFSVSYNPINVVTKGILIVYRYLIRTAAQLYTVVFSFCELLFNTRKMCDVPNSVDK